MERRRLWWMSAVVTLGVACSGTSTGSPTEGMTGDPATAAIASGLLEYAQDHNISISESDAACFGSEFSSVIDTHPDMRSMTPEELHDVFVGSAGEGLLPDLDPADIYSFMDCIGPGHMIEFSLAALEEPGSEQRRLSDASEHCLRRLWDNDAAFRESITEDTSDVRQADLQIEHCLTDE